MKRKDWASQLDAIVRRIRARPEIRKLTERDILRIVDEVRRSRHCRTTRHRAIKTRRQA